MDLKERFNGNYITSKTLKDEPELLKPLTVEKVYMDDVNKEEKVVIDFKNIDKSLVVNHTNYKSISEVLGSETDNWIGSEITLKIADALFNNEKTDSVRIEKVE